MNIASNLYMFYFCTKATMYTRIMYINPFDIMWISYVTLSLWEAKFVLYVFAGKMWWKMWKHGKALNSKIVLVCRQKQEMKRSCMCPTGQILVSKRSFLADFTWTEWSGKGILFDVFEEVDDQRKRKPTVGSDVVRRDGHGSGIKYKVEKWWLV